jgi:hypothetical protein
VKQGDLGAAPQPDGDDLMKASRAEFESLTVVSRVDTAAPRFDDRG